MVHHDSFVAEGLRDKPVQPLSISFHNPIPYTTGLEEHETIIYQEANRISSLLARHIPQSLFHAIIGTMMRHHPTLYRGPITDFMEDHIAKETVDA